MRKRPYTQIGIRRKKCIRCGKQAVHQWQICADGNQYRPLCLECDIAVNRAVLEFMGFPNADEMIERYIKKMR